MAERPASHAGRMIMKNYQKIPGISCQHNLKKKCQDQPGPLFRVKAPVARRPPHRSVREDFPHTVLRFKLFLPSYQPIRRHPDWRITLLPCMHSDIMDYSRKRQFKRVEGLLKRFVTQITVPVSPAKPSFPCLFGVSIHEFKCIIVAAHSEILIKSSKLADQRLVLLLQRNMTVFFAPPPYHSHKTVSSLTHRAFLDRPVTLEAFPPVKGEPEKVECPFRLPVSGWPAKSDHLGLFRVKVQLVTVEPCRQQLHYPLHIQNEAVGGAV